MLQLARTVVAALLCPGLVAAAPPLLDMSQLGPLSFDDEETSAAPASTTDSPAPLPAPALAEPFAIGEALYDPSRAPVAVVSLLDLLGVSVVANEAAADAAQQPTLSEAEVRLLIEMGVADAKAASENADSAPPYSLADLHGLLASHMPELDLGVLAAAYADAYAERPESVVSKVLMGQPLELETPLSRVHVWMLLVDAFVGLRGPAAFSGGAVNAVLRSGGPPTRSAVALGDAPQRASSNVRVDLAAMRQFFADWKRREPDWWWLVQHQMLIASRIPLVVTPRAVSAHEGHGGPGRTVTLSASLGASPPTIRAPSGRAVLVPRAPANRRPVPMAWQIDSGSLSRLQAHGTLQGAHNSPVPVSPGGTLQLAYVPKRERAEGRGTQADDFATVRATVELHDLLQTVYDSGPGVRTPSLLAEGRIQRSVPVRLEWHTFGLKLKLVSSFSVGLDFGARTYTRRAGLEGVSGVLEKQADGSYRGVVRGMTLSLGATESPFRDCPVAKSKGTQKLVVTARPVTGLDRNQDPAQMRASVGAMDGGYLELAFEPATDPVFSARDECQDGDEHLRPGSSGGLRFLPFNDSRWTAPEHSFVIAIPRAGKLAYHDASLADSTPPAELGPFRKIITGTYTMLEVEVEREEEP